MEGENGILSVLREILAQIGQPSRKWLTPEEAAQYLRVSKSKIYKAIAEDRIPHHKLPDSNLVRLRISDLDEWIERGESSSKEISERIIRGIL